MAGEPGVSLRLDDKLPAFRISGKYSSLYSRWSNLEVTRRTDCIPAAEFQREGRKGDYQCRRFGGVEDALAGGRYPRRAPFAGKCSGVAARLGNCRSGASLPFLPQRRYDFVAAGGGSGRV